MPICRSPNEPVTPVHSLVVRWWRPFQTNPRPSPILVDELNPGANQHTFYFANRFRITRISPHFNVGDSVSINPGGFRQLANGPV